MKTSCNNLLAAMLAVLVLVCVPLVCAADPAASSGAAAPAKAKRTTYPFHGYVASVSPSDGTVSLKKNQGARVLGTDSQSIILVNGQESSIGAIVPGLYGHGTVHKDSTGTEVIVKAKFDTAAPANTKSSTAAAAATSAATSGVSPATTGVADTTDGVVKKTRKKTKKTLTNMVDQATSPGTVSTPAGQ